MAPGAGTSSSTHHPSVAHPQEGMFLAAEAPLPLEAVPLAPPPPEAGAGGNETGIFHVCPPPQHVMGRVEW